MDATFRTHLLYNTALARVVAVAALTGCVVFATIQDAHASFWDGWTGDDAAQQQAADLGGKRVPEGNAGVRTPAAATQFEAYREPAEPMQELGVAGDQRQPMAPVPEQAPMVTSVSPDVAPMTSADYSAPLAPPPPMQAQPPMIVEAPAPAPEKKSEGLMGWLGLDADDDEVEPAPAMTAAAPVANAQPDAPMIAMPENMNAQQLMPPAMNAQQPPVVDAPVVQQAQTQAAPQRYSPPAENPSALQVRVMDGGPVAPAAPAAASVEYYDANGYPILAATPPNPAAPAMAEQAQKMAEMQQLNQAAEGTREAFMARGEQAFAPQPAQAYAPAPLDQPLPMDAAPAPVANNAAAELPWPEQPAMAQAPAAPAPAQPVAYAVPEQQPQPQPVAQPAYAPMDALASAPRDANGLPQNVEMMPPPAMGGAMAAAPEMEARMPINPPGVEREVAMNQAASSQPYDASQSVLPPPPAEMQAMEALSPAQQEQAAQPIVLEPRPEPRPVVDNVVAAPQVAEMAPAPVAAGLPSPTSFDEPAPRQPLRLLPESRYAARRLSADIR